MKALCARWFAFPFCRQKVISRTRPLSIYRTTLLPFHCNPSLSQTELDHVHSRGLLSNGCLAVLVNYVFSHGNVWFSGRVCWRFNTRCTLPTNSSRKLTSFSHEEKNAADAKPSPGLRSKEDQPPDAINLEQARQRLNDFLADSDLAYLQTYTAPYTIQAVVIDAAKSRMAGKIAAFEESFNIARQEQ